MPGHPQARDHLLINNASDGFAGPHQTALDLRSGSGHRCGVRTDDRIGRVELQTPDVTTWPHPPEIGPRLKPLPLLTRDGSIRPACLAFVVSVPWNRLP